MAPRPDAPYPGPRPFERADEKRFFGRENEAAALASLVVAHPLVLLSSQSGAGKTSLINAKLVPLLEQRGCKLHGPTRVGVDLPADVELARVKNVFGFSAAVGLAEKNSDLTALAGKSLSDQVASWDGFAAPEGIVPPRVLIFDQFEELFTKHDSHWRHRAAFFEELALALDTNVGLRVLLSMREEYVGSLTPHAPGLPEGLRVRFRLERLDAEGATQAAKRPLQGTAYSFAPGVEKKLVESLLMVPVRTPDGIQNIVGEFVEPVQLQIVCTSLWDSLPEGQKLIDAHLLDECGSVDDALASYYESCIRKLVAEACSEADLRHWLETQLITREGTRGTVYSDGQTTAGLSNKVVAKLEEMRLLRQEPRAGVPWYELTHDRFIEPIRRSNNQFRLKRAGWVQSLELSAEKWRASGRHARDLLNAAELVVVGRLLAPSDAAELGFVDRPLVDDFVAKSREAASVKQRADKEEATKRRQRSLIGALVVSVAALAVFVGLAIYAFNRRAEAELLAAKKGEIALANQQLLAKFISARLTDAARKSMLTDVTRSAVMARQAADIAAKQRLKATEATNDLLKLTQASKAFPIVSPTTSRSWLNERTGIGLLSSSSGFETVALATGLTQQAPLPGGTVVGLSSSGLLRTCSRLGEFREWQPESASFVSLSKVSDVYLSSSSLQGSDATGTLALVRSLNRDDKKIRFRPRVLDFGRARVLPVLPSQVDDAVLVSISNDDDKPLLTTWSGDGKLSVWRLDGRDWSESKGIRQPNGSLAAVAASGTWYAYATADGGVVLESTAANRPPTPLLAAGAASKITLLRFSANGENLAVLQEDGSLTIWNTESRKPMATHHLPPTLGPPALDVSFGGALMIGEGKLLHIALTETREPDPGLLKLRPTPEEYAQALQGLIPELDKAVQAVSEGKLDVAREALISGKRWPGIEFTDGVEQEVRGARRRVLLERLEALLSDLAEQGEVERIEQEVAATDRELSAIQAEPSQAGMLAKFRDRALSVAASRALEGKDFPRSIELFHKALDLAGQAPTGTKVDSITTSTEMLNNLCWDGSVNGYAPQVLFACDRAVAAAPDNAGVRDSRGLARALAGDRAGALQDFEFFLKKAFDSDSGLLNRRRRWVAQLKVNKDPISAQDLDDLRNGVD
jgi:WD40 repeat protein